MGRGRRVVVWSILLVLLVGGGASLVGAQSPDSWDRGTITVHKFHDVDWDGVQDAGEVDIEGWLIRLYRWCDTGPYVVAEGYTGMDGTVTFGDLVPTLYEVWEERRECWVPTTLVGLNPFDGGYHTVALVESGQATTVVLSDAYVCSPEPERCIDLVKTGPETAFPGDEVTYHYWVHNCGDIVLASGAHVYDPLLSDDELWDGDLEPGQIHEFDMPYTLPEDVCGDFVNHAWAIGRPLGYPSVRDDDEWIIDVLCEPVPEPGIAVLKEPDSQSVSSGDTVTFTITVSNTGNVDLGPVVIDDLYALGCDVEIDSLGAGQSYSYDCVVGDITEAFTNVVVVTGTVSTGEIVTDMDDAAVDVVANPDIAVYKEPDTQSIEPGDSVTFTITVVNTGSMDLGPVVVDDLYALGCDTEIEHLAVGQIYSYDCVVDGITESFTNVVLVTGTVSTGETVTDTDDATVEVVVNPGIVVQKLVDVGDGMLYDADSAPGPYVLAGNDVWIQIEVTNVGNVTLAGSTLEDDAGLDLSGCVVPDLAPDESYVCRVGPLGAVAGQHENTVTVTTDYGGASYTDSDGAHYFGAAPNIDLQKQVQVEGGEWVDADAAPGPIALVGQDVRFRFVVVNVGNVPLSGVMLYDDQVDVSGCEIPADLDPDEIHECVVGPSSAVRGQYENTAVVSASYGGETYEAQDSGFYFGADPVIHVENYVGRAQDVNWYDADTEGSALSVDAGADLWFRVEVMNTGNVTLTNVMLSDSVLDLGGCAVPNELAPSEVFDDCFVGPVDALDGLNVYIATVTGDYLGDTYGDDDPAYYVGAAGSGPAISVKKYVQVTGSGAWLDADDWNSAPAIDDGDQLSFRFVISNTGSVTLTDITLEDDVIDLDVWTNCTPPLILEPDQEFSCVIDLEPGATDRCAHTNYATATGLYDGVLYTDNDPVHYYGPDWPCGAPVALKLEPSATQVQTGDQVTFTVTAYTAAGIPWDVTEQTTFEISSGAQGSWRGSSYTGGAVGTWIVTGSYGGVSATVSIDVTYARIWLPLVWRSAGE